MILASGDLVGWLGVGVGVASMVLGSVTASVLARVQRNQQLQDTDRQEHGQRVRQLERSLGDAAAKQQEMLVAAAAEQHVLIEKLVDERFRHVSHEVKNHGQMLVNTIDDIKARLESGDGKMDGLVNSDHKIELKVSEKMETLKDDIREMFRDHEQVDARSFQSLGGKMAEMSTQIGILAAIKRDAVGVKKQ